MRNSAFISALFAFGMVIASAPALAEQKGDRGPDWKRAPSEQDFLSVFPRAAMEAGKGGKVQLSCKVTVTGVLSGCKVASETPPGLGFGQAALAVVPQMLMSPAIKDGRPVEVDDVTIPVIFPKPGASTGSRISGISQSNMETFAVLNKVPWTATPSVSDVWAAYPAKARAEKLSGRITLECTIRTSGEIGSCQSRNRDADSEVFVPAAKALATKFRAPLKFDDGASTAGVRVLLPFEFQADQAQAPTFASRLPWLAIPSGEQFESELGPVLTAAGAKEVRIRAECLVGPDAHLKDCSVLSSTPELAQLQGPINRLAPSFILPRWSETGSTYIGGKVVVPLKYSLP